MDENTPITDKNGYNKLLKEIDNENKRINDPLTDAEQKKVSTERLGKLNKLKDDYLAKGQPKNHLQPAMKGARENYLKSAAAYTPDMNSSKDASLKANPEILAADEERNKAKMADARNSANNAAVEEAENNVQEISTEEVEAPELNETDEAAIQAQNDIEEAVAGTKGDGTPTTSQTVIEKLSNKYDIPTTFTPDGKIVPTEESQWKRADASGKLAMFGTALSCIISALSGGNIPPINFNKIMGVDKQYTTYLANVHQYNEAISSGVKKGAENKANADYAGFMSSLPDRERTILENISSDYELTKAAADKERLGKQGEVQKGLIDAQAQSAVTMLISLQDARDKGLISQKTFDDFLQLKRAEFGQWSGLWERITDRAGIKAGVSASGKPYGGVNVGN